MTGPAPVGIVAIVAARDEADQIVATVTALRRFVDRVVVADDGSRDATASLAAGAGALIVRRPTSGGKGAALEEAIRAAGTAQIYLLADADLGATAATLEALLEPARSHAADVVVGVLPPAPGGGLGLVRRLSGGLIRLAGGPMMAAPMSGQRALTAEALAALRPLAGGFGVETAMGIDAARAGLRVMEVPVAAAHRPRGRGVAGFAHRARQGVHLLAAALPRLLAAPRGSIRARDAGEAQGR